MSFGMQSAETQNGGPAKLSLLNVYFKRGYMSAKLELMVLAAYLCKIYLRNDVARLPSLQWNSNSY